MLGLGAIVMNLLTRGRPFPLEGLIAFESICLQAFLVNAWLLLRGT